MPGKPHQHRRLGVHGQADGPAHLRVARQPVDTRLRAAHQVFVMAQEILEQFETGRRTGARRRAAGSGAHAHRTHTPLLPRAHTARAAPASPVRIAIDQSCGVAATSRIQ
jgi:hypothetical protein